MHTLRSLLLIAAAAAILVSCRSLPHEPGIYLDTGTGEVESGGTLPLSAFIDLPAGTTSYTFEWETSGGTIRKTRVENAVDFMAPQAEGVSEITVTYRGDGLLLTDTAAVKVLQSGALAPESTVLIKVDTNTLSGVFVDEKAPAESFTPPLTIKGTFTYDPSSGHAASGGNWQTYLMYDDGTHGDETADDGIWSLLMVFEKTTEKVYFAFDEASPYRVQWESGLAWRLKVAWIDLDDFPNDRSNPAFIPEKDQILFWDAGMAEAGGLR